MYTVQWGCWLLAPLEWVAGLRMGTSTARGARFPVPNRSYPAEREPARSSPTHPIARLSGSERLRRSTAKILLALLYKYIKTHVLRCTIIGFKQKYGHSSSRSADESAMRSRVHGGNRSVFCPGILVLNCWVVGRRSWDCVIWRHPCSNIYIKHHTIEKCLIETSNRRLVWWVSPGGKWLHNQGNFRPTREMIENILYVWFSHFTFTEAHRC